MSTTLKRCSRCVCDESIPGFKLDQNNICNYCDLHDKFDKQYPINDQSILHMTDRIKKDGKNKQFDCVVGVSGGCDSSYLLYKAIEWGLRPIAVHYNNGWNTEIATQNMHNVTKSLCIPFEEYIISEEINDIWKAFLKADVPDIEAPTDIALATIAYQTAAKYNVKYILNGHSFRTEGVAPLGVSYMDGKYIADVHKQFGTMPMKTFPNLWLSDWLYWIMKGIKRVRPLYHIDYNKEKAKKILSEEFDWKWYGHHHGDNEFTAFFRNHYRNNIFKIDSRITEFSALIRSGQMAKVKALEQLEQPLKFEGDLENVRNRLDMSQDEWNTAMTYPTKTHNDFKNYKSTFKKLKPLFWLAYKRNLIPETFYIKYCK
jgi:tRNA(Ile)-lysidine synthase TilS/MesJ